MLPKTCFIIAGPTAVGKTSLAISLARHFYTDIISADSRQCFREMSIGVAKPSPGQLSQVKHYFINSHSIHEQVNAAVFEQYALTAIEDIFQQKDIAIMVGGTGLYIKAFCEGMDEMPPVSPAIREQVQLHYAEQGMPWLQQEIKEKDPLYFSTGEMHNPQRLMRALEVRLATGRSIRDFQRAEKAARNFRIIKIGLTLPKEELHRNIHHRVDEMMKEGLAEEVRSLLPFRHLNALQTVGYSELSAYLDGKISQEQAVEQIKTNTRQYAKRQMTWFRKDGEMHWFSPYNADAIVQYIESTLA